MLDLQQDQGALDDRQRAPVLAPGAAVFQPRVAAMPGVGLRGAVAGGVGAAGVLGGRPGDRVGEPQQGAAAERAASDGRGVEDRPVGTRPGPSAAARSAPPADRPAGTSTGTCRSRSRARSRCRGSLGCQCPAWRSRLMVSRNWWLSPRWRRRWGRAGSWVPTPVRGRPDDGGQGAAAGRSTTQAGQKPRRPGSVLALFRAGKHRDRLHQLRVGREGWWALAARLSRGDCRLRADTVVSAYAARRRCRGAGGSRWAGSGDV